MSQAIERVARVLRDKHNAPFEIDTAPSAEWTALARAAILAFLDEGDEEMRGAVKRAALDMLDQSGADILVHDSVAEAMANASLAALRSLAEGKETTDG